MTVLSKVSQWNLFEKQTAKLKFNLLVAKMKNYNELVFVAKDIRFNFLYIFSNNIVAFFDRKGYYRKFCADNGITNELAAKKYLPHRYLVQHPRIERFGKSRDRIIVQLFIDYQNKSLNTDYAIRNTEKKINEQKDTIREYESQLNEFEKRLKNENDAAEKIYLQSTISNLGTTIKNQKLVLEGMEDQHAEYLGIQINNEENWTQQLKQVEDEVDSCINDFIRKLCKKITRKLSYINFEYIKPEYSDKVKDIKGVGAANASSKNKK
jgi:hypothetical protein